MRDLGASVQWPVAPLGLEKFADRLMKMHALWRANRIISSLPQHLKESLSEKVSAFEALEGKRPEWGYTRSWRGNYLNTADELEPMNQMQDYNTALDTIKHSHQYSEVLFSSYVQVSFFVALHSFLHQPRGVFR
ncbi:unnamed protein product [Gongylonema pulchrum]|uniref:DHC_N2 domain-containing protein n=1 Tax=Gongylonema pulchrum TaxID=637853 RepID=A0A183D4D6_9BILA|nr:unnamed protein product [Gongylonema pulchrum]